VTGVGVLEQPVAPAEGPSMGVVGDRTSLERLVYLEEWTTAVPSRSSVAEGGIHAYQGFSVDLPGRCRRRSSTCADHAPTGQCSGSGWG
jgi:hypothetical protein